MAGKMAHWLRTYDTLAKDQNSIPSTYTVQSTASNSSCKGPNISGLGGDPNSRHIHKQYSKFLCILSFYLHIIYTNVSGALGQKTA